MGPVNNSDYLIIEHKIIYAKIWAKTAINLKLLIFKVY